MRIFVMLSVITVFLYCQSSGSTINVPGDINTIQGAINIAEDGDTVLVAEGTYYENINFKGKAITVASQFLMDEDTSRIAKTIIDGSQPSHPDSGSVVYFDNGEDTTSVLYGFTITGGTGTRTTYIDPDFGLGVMRQGGGIFVNSSGAKIVHNIVRDNKVQTTLHATGGGIRARAVPAGKTVLIANNHILNNVVDVPENSGGGGIDIYNISVEGGRYIVKENVIENNHVYISKTWKAWGGGLACHLNLPFRGEVIICGNTIRNNELHCFNTFGAGIYITYWQQSNIIDYNTNPIIYNNLIYNNNSPKHGSAISIWNLFRHKYPNADISLRPFICNNTIVDNIGVSAIHIFQSIPFFINNILKNFNSSSCDFRFEVLFDARTAYNGIELYNNSIADTTSLLAYSSYHNLVNNIYFEDPLFADSENYYLSAESPCIDAGYDSTIFNDEEIGGVAVWPAMGTMRNDMGAYGGNPDSIFKYVTAIDNQIKQELYIPVKYLLYQNYPNPFNSSTTIEFSLPKSEFVELRVYNILGKEVSTLVSNKLNQGNHSYTFDGKNLASGIYYYQLVAGDFREVKKMIYLK